MSYTTALKVSQFAGGGVKESDIRSDWLAWADALIDDWVGHNYVATTTYTDEVYDGNGTETLVLRHRPVASVSSVKVSDTALTASTYKVYDWGIKMDNSYNTSTLLPYQMLEADYMGSKIIFPTGTQNIEVTYVAGSASVPVRVQLAATMIVSKIALASREGGGGTSQRWSQGAFQAGDPNMGAFPLSMQGEFIDILRVVLRKDKPIRLRK